MVVHEYCNCYIIRKISSKISKIYDNALKNSGLKITQYAILKYISILKKLTSKTSLPLWIIIGVLWEEI